MAAGHEVLEHTADVGVRAWGDSMEETFEQAAWGLVDVAGVRGEGPRRRREIAVSGVDPGALLVDFLNELILVFDTEAASVAAITVRGVTDTDLEAEVELVASSCEAEGVGVKAATYHQLRVERRPAGGFEARVFLDV